MAKKCRQEKKSTLHSMFTANSFERVLKNTPSNVRARRLCHFRFRRSNFGRQNTVPMCQVRPSSSDMRPNPAGACVLETTVAGAAYGGQLVGLNYLASRRPRLRVEAPEA